MRRCFQTQKAMLFLKRKPEGKAASIEKEKKDKSDFFFLFFCILKMQNSSVFFSSPAMCRRSFRGRRSRCGALCFAQKENEADKGTEKGEEREKEKSSQKERICRERAYFRGRRKRRKRDGKR